jgi:hypothetical protein
MTSGPKHNRHDLFSGESAAGWTREGTLEPADHRDPLTATIEAEEQLLGAVEDAAAAFADDRCRNVCCHETALQILGHLMPGLPSKLPSDGSLAGIGRRALGLAVLLKYCAASCADLSRLYGGTRASYSFAVKNLAKEVGLIAPDRSPEACNAYRERAKETWKKRHAAGLGKSGKLPSKRKGTPTKAEVPARKSQPAKEGTGSHG